MTVFLYLLAIEFFDAPVALLITVFGMIYYQSSVVFINYDFLQFLTVYSLAACWLICSHFRLHAKRSAPIGELISWRLIAAGILAGMAFLTKQSNGAFVALFLGLSVVLAAIGQGPHAIARSGANFFLGSIIPILATGIWLSSHDLLDAFLENTLRGGAASKGGISAILFGWIPRLITKGRLKGLILVAATTALWLGEGLWKYRKNPAGLSLDEAPFRKYAQLWFFWTLLLICIYLPYCSVRLSYTISARSALNYFHSILPLLGTLFAGIMVVGGIYLRFVKRHSAAVPILIVSMTCLGFILGNATSAAVDMAGAFLAVALLFGFILSIPLPTRWTKMALSGICGIFLIYLCSQKYITPYIWWGLSQGDVREATDIPDVPALSGMKLCFAENGAVFRDVVKLIEQYSTPGDTMFTFPHMAQLHLLGQRYPPTYAAVHWFDVASDEISIHDAQVLKVSPPKIIVFLDIPETVWKAHESGFRAGRRSGQRKIRRVISDLIDAGRYELVLRRWVPDKNILTLWVRRDFRVKEKV